MILHDCSELFYVDNTLKYTHSKIKIIKLTSHMQPINNMIIHQNRIATCSDDLTIRLWQCKKSKIVPDTIKHIWAGRTYFKHQLYGKLSRFIGQWVE